MEWTNDKEGTWSRFGDQLPKEQSIGNDELLVKPVRWGLEWTGACDSENGRMRHDRSGSLQKGPAKGPKERPPVFIASGYGRYGGLWLMRLVPWMWAAAMEDPAST